MGFRAGKKVSMSLFHHYYEIRIFTLFKIFFYVLLVIMQFSNFFLIVLEIFDSSFLCVSG